MAVYTQLTGERLAEIVAQYDVGELVSAKGIAEGVSNSNWIVETTRNRFILTMYESRTDISDLPFFLGLLDHLAAKGGPVPRTIHDRAGDSYRLVDGKAVALIEFLPGVSVDMPTPAQAQSVGRALAGMHLSVADFPQSRQQMLGLDSWEAVMSECGSEQLASIDPTLPDLAFAELGSMTDNWPRGLPQGVVHCDLFPDNVLMLGNEVSGLIDFYFAATDAFAYDLAVTHAAWCFADSGQTFRPEVSAALLGGYQEVRGLQEDERTALPVLARGACMRFISSRAWDWLNTPAAALVTRKDPMDFARRLQFYRDNGETIFADAGQAG